MDVDPAGGDQLAIGVDLAFAGAGFATDLRDAIAIDGNVAGEAFRARAVDDRAAPDDDIMHQ